MVANYMSIKMTTTATNTIVSIHSLASRGTREHLTQDDNQQSDFAIDYEDWDNLDCMAVVSIYFFEVNRINK